MVRARTCAVCKDPIPAEERGSFCSKRCELLDLGKWMEGEHRIETPLEEIDELLLDEMLLDEN